MPILVLLTAVDTMAGVAGYVNSVLLGFFHWRLSIWTNGRIYFRVLQALLYPYSIVVVGIGLYMACLPRAIPRQWCSTCRYDLSGLENEVDLCPECGEASVVNEEGCRKCYSCGFSEC